MAVEKEWGAKQPGGGAERPPMTGGASLLLEAWPTCHEWVWVDVDVCHVGCAAMPHQQSV